MWAAGDGVVPVNRRRLSLGEVDGAEDTAAVIIGQDVNEDDRHMITSLSQQQVFDFIKEDANAGRRYSLGSETDKNLQNAGSFSSKSTKLEGANFDNASECIGYACKKGLKPEAPNQDSFLIMKIEGQCALYGVFDGHGRKGHDVSNFVKDNLPKILFSQKEFNEDPAAALEKTFEKMQYLIEKATAMKIIDASRSGTTCSIVLHCIPQCILYVAHVGDSRVVLGRKVRSEVDPETLIWEAVDLTIDHKPDLPEERARIESNGGVVVFDGGWNYRVFAKNKKDSRGKRYPGLNMSRAMGDLTGFHDAGISAVPDVLKHLLTEPAAPKSDPTKGPVSPPGEVEGGRERSPSKPSVTSVDLNPNDRFLMLCSDGVWEFLKSEDAVNEVTKFKAQDAMAAAEHICQLSWRQWISAMDGQVVDDITAVIIHF